MGPGPLTPGVYVGSWEILTVGGFRLGGYRHACIATVDRLGHTAVTELVGPPDHWRSEIVTRDHPYYAPFGGYHWIQVAPVTAIMRINEGVRMARMRFAGTVYRVADSNRFVGMALRHARITLSAHAILSIGAAPALFDG
jgi:hypothetical protein